MIILFFIGILKASSNNYCFDCKTFTTPSDCDSLIPLCSWTQNSCVEGYVKPQINLYAQQTTLYCSQNFERCSLTYGCSFYNDICIRFLGCDAYQSYSDQDCIRISYLCMWNDEKQGCIRSPYYDNDGNVIKQRICNEAHQIWRSKEGCPKYSSQCIFNGIQCTEYLSSCNQYSTTKETCDQLIGVDGLCEFQINCKAKTCGSYNSVNCIQYRSDCYLDEQSICQQKQKCENNNVSKKSQCLNKIEQNCYFDGRTCSQKSLKLCSEQSQELCQGSVGRDGICILQNKKCIKLQCQHDENKLYQKMEIFDDYCQNLYICEQQNSGCTKIDQQQCSNIFIVQKDCQCQQCTLNKQECINATSQQECIQYKQLNSNIPCYWNQDQNICLSATRCSQLQNKSSCQKLKPTCVFRNNICYDVLEFSCTQITNVEKGEGIIEKYCQENRGCSILSNQCVNLSFECGSYTSYSTCFKNLQNQPCVWNQDRRQCLRYRERGLLKKYECETMSNLWTFQDENCQIRKHCTLLNDTQIGLEGSCLQYRFEQLQQIKNNCSELVREDCENMFHNKCYFDQNSAQCRNLECSNLNQTSCKPIKGFKIQDYKYCRLFGEVCIEILPMNEKDCILYSGGSKFFIDNYCVSCKQEIECQWNFQSDQSEFQSQFEDVIVKKLKLSNANFVLQYGEPKFDTKQLMQSEAQRIFNQYSQIVKDEKRPQVFGFINQQTNAFLKRIEEHRQILKQQIELQIKICQGNILLQKALLSYDQKK